MSDGLCCEEAWIAAELWRLARSLRQDEFVMKTIPVLAARSAGDADRSAERGRARARRRWAKEAVK
jgi:hypothetical protein